MTPYVIRKPGEFRQCPWKNRRGVTRELYAAYAPEEERFLWRISMAGVDQDGPFSDFSGYDRALLLLKGKGMTLHYPDSTSSILKEPLDMALFSGDGETRATLFEGPVGDFNVMTRRDRCSARILRFLSSEKKRHTLPREGTHLLVYLPWEPGTLISPLGGEIPLPEEHLFHLSSLENETSPWTLRCRRGIGITITEK